MNLSHGKDEALLWFNGEVLPAGEAHISPMDRGLLYGDGLFETMRVEAALSCILRTTCVESRSRPPPFE